MRAGFPDRLRALKAACKAAHREADKGGADTCSFCVCGHPRGGPAGTDACRALSDLLLAFDALGWLAEARDMETLLSLQEWAVAFRDDGNKEAL